MKIYGTTRVNNAYWADPCPEWYVGWFYLAKRGPFRQGGFAQRTPRPSQSQSSPIHYPSAIPGTSHKRAFNQGGMYGGLVPQREGEREGERDRGREGERGRERKRYGEHIG